MSSTHAELAPGALATDRKGGLPFGLVALVFVTLLAAGLTLAWYIHGRYVGFERVVAQHVTPDAALVVRWDVEKVSLFEPTRRFLLPLLDATRSPSAGGATRRERLSQSAKLEIGRDLREVLVLFGPSPGDWAVVFGGSFPKGELTRPIQSALEGEGTREEAGRITSPDGLALGRAEDGAFVLASSAARLAATLPARTAPEQIRRTGAGSFIAKSESAGLPEGGAALLSALGPVERVTGEATWGSPLRVTLTLHFRGDPPADARQRVQTALARLLGEDLARLEQRFGRFEVHPAGNHALELRFSLDDTALEHAADRAAEAVLSGLALRPALE